MTATQQLREFVDLGGYVQLQILDEDARSGRMRVSGVFQRADTKNANGRIYSSSLWERVLSDPKLHQALQSRLMLGEVEHPKDGVTNLARVSHVITGLRRKGNEIIGEAEILNTPAGQVIQELIRAKCQVGISSRGRGTSQLRGGVEHVDESSFQLDTFDFVYKPSTPGAYVGIEESLKGPYGKQTVMEDKVNELKRLEVLAIDAKQRADKANLDTLRGLYKAAVEAEASAATLLSQVQESEDGKEHVAYAETVLAQVREAKELLLNKLDEAHGRSDLDRRLESALGGDRAWLWSNQTTTSSGNGSTEVTITGTKQESETDALRAILNEVREQRDHFKTRFESTKRTLEASTDEIRTRYSAAVELGNAMLARLTEAQDVLSELTQEHERLKERYQAATAMVANVIKLKDEAKMTKRVHEAIKQYPVLAKLQKSLLSCKDESELEERISEFVDALGLPVQDKQEALTRQVILRAARTEQAAPVPMAQPTTGIGEAMGENAELPQAGSNESSQVLTEVLSGLTESSEPGDRRAAAVVRMIQARGMK